MRFAILDDEHAPLRGAARDRQRVVAGPLQLQRQIRRGERVADHAGLRRPRGDSDLARSRDSGPNKRRRGKDEGIFGTERVRPRRAETEQEETRQSDAADDIGEDLRRYWLAPPRSRVFPEV